MNLHIEYCKEFGISKEEIQATEEHQGAKSLFHELSHTYIGFQLLIDLPACTAYTRYVLDIGQSEDWLALQIALAPCLFGYGAIAKQLQADPRTKKEGNTYWLWIMNYVVADDAQALQTESGEISFQRAST